MAKLVIYETMEGEKTVFEDFELSANRILIGSAPENHLVLDAPEVDPAHASLEYRNDHWILQDLGGQGGTRVNAHHVDGPCRLQHNDLIELAGIKMTFQDDAWEAQPKRDDRETRSEKDEENISGRVWFATLAGGTVAVIFIILLLLIVADILGVIQIADLIPGLK